MALQLLRRHGIRSLRPFSTSARLTQDAPPPGAAPPPPAGKPPANGNGNSKAASSSSGAGAGGKRKIDWTMERDKPNYTMRDLQTLVSSYSTEQQHAFTQMEKEEKIIDPDIYKLVRPMREGDVMAPHHFSFQAYKKQLAGQRNKTLYEGSKDGRDGRDVFDRLKMDPLDHYKNYRIMQGFVTSMGRIKHSSVTGLRPRNQRRMAKAVRRAVGIGLLPSTHCHPELLRGQQEEDGRDLPAARDQPGTKRDRYTEPAGQYPKFDISAAFPINPR